MTRQTQAQNLFMRLKNIRLKKKKYSWPETEFAAKDGDLTSSKCFYIFLTGINLDKVSEEPSDMEAI